MKYSLSSKIIFKHDYIVLVMYIIDYLKSLFVVNYFVQVIWNTINIHIFYTNYWVLKVLYVDYKNNINKYFQ